MTSCAHKTDQPVENSMTEQEATQVVNAFFEALSEGDSLKMRSLLAPEFYMFEHDVIWNEDSLLWLMPRTLGRIWTVHDVTFSTQGDMGHIAYYNESAKPLGRSWYESMLLKKADGELKIHFMHSTKLYLK